jgi:RIO kinase 1
MWALFEQGELKPETPLTGIYIDNSAAPDLGDVIVAIDEARDEAVRRQRGREVANAGADG